MITKYKTYLNKLQSEAYDSKRFLVSIRNTKKANKINFTKKLKIIFITALTITLLPLCFINNFLGLTIFIVFIGFFYYPIWLANEFFKLLEKIYKNYQIRKYKIKIDNLKSKNLKVIAITGSAGKTTVKNIVTKILKTKYKVLQTPKSYNTFYGITKVINYELDDSYNFFVVEVGAYKIGEIKEIMKFLQPDYSILTTINEQHIERFGNIKNTTQAKFEIIDYAPKDNIAFANATNKRIKNRITNNNIYKKVIQYGILQESMQQTRKNIGVDLLNYNYKVEPENSVINFTYNNLQSQFKVKIKNNLYNFKTRMLGKNNAQNILVSALLCEKIGISKGTIQNTINSLKPLDNRLQIKKLKNYTLIENSYSSNVEGFKENIEIAKNTKRELKVIVTGGIVELGFKEQEIHNKLGKKINTIFDYVFLVGKNSRTKALSKNIKKNKVTFIKNTLDYKEQIEKLKLKDIVVLMENDIGENYN